MSSKNTDTADTVYVTFSTSSMTGSDPFGRHASVHLPTKKARAKFTVRPSVRAGLQERQQMRGFGYAAETFEARRDSEHAGRVVLGNGMRVRVK